MIKDEFERRGRDDVNSVQALLLYNIGDKELTASELRTRGYYLGSNVSYNVKKLVEMGYLHHARSRVDRRSVRISLTDKGRQVHEIVKALYDKHARTIEPIGGISDDDFAAAQPGPDPPRALLDRPDPLPALISADRCGRSDPPLPFDSPWTRGARLLSSLVLSARRRLSVERAVLLVVGCFVIVTCCSRLP